MKTNSHPSSVPNTLSLPSSQSSVISSSEGEESIIDYTSELNNSTHLNSSQGPKNKKNNKYQDQDQLIAILESITQVTKNFQKNSYEKINKLK